MDFEYWWLLAFPLFFGLGWLAARIDLKQLLSESRRLPASCTANRPVRPHRAWRKARFQNGLGTKKIEARTGCQHASRHQPFNCRSSGSHHDMRSQTRLYRRSGKTRQHCDRIKPAQTALDGDRLTSARARTGFAAAYLERKNFLQIDKVFACEAANDFGPAYVQAARTAFVANAERARIKRRINLLLDSEIVEEKTY